MNRKRIGILLVVLAILIGGIAVFTFFVNDQEPKKEKTKVEKETEKEIVTLPEQEEAPGRNRGARRTGRCARKKCIY